MKYLLLILVLAGAAYLCRDLLKPAPAGSLLGMPLQTATTRLPFQVGDYRIRPLADYQISARVYGRQSYKGQDKGDLLPQDLALGWGMLGEEQNAKVVSISQGDRYSFLNSGDVLDMYRILRNFSNVHIIPANRQIAQFIETLTAGDFIELNGCLVEVKAKDGATMTSSLVRDDQGEGACEVMYVDRANRIRPDGTAPAPVKIASEAAPMPARPAGVRPAAPTAPAPGGNEVTLPRNLTISLEHGSMTIPAGEKIIILSRRNGRANIRYHGFTAWVEEGSLR